MPWSVIHQSRQGRMAVARYVSEARLRAEERVPGTESKRFLPRAAGPRAAKRSARNPTADLSSIKLLGPSVGSPLVCSERKVHGCSRLSKCDVAIAAIGRGTRY